MSTFYEQLSTTSLAVLGLWFVVVQLRADSWAKKPGMRWKATGVSLALGIPGLLGLLSLVDTDRPGLWQVSFFVGAGLGAVGIALALQRVRPREAPWVTAGLGLAAVLQAAVATVAVVAAADSDHDVVAEPLVVEGVLLALLLAVGLALAWSLVFER